MVLIVHLCLVNCILSSVLDIQSLVLDTLICVLGISFASDVSGRFNMWWRNINFFLSILISISISPIFQCKDGLRKVLGVASKYLTYINWMFTGFLLFFTHISPCLTIVQEIEEESKLPYILPCNNCSNSISSTIIDYCFCLYYTGNCLAISPFFDQILFVN